MKYAFILVTLLGSIVSIAQESDDLYKINTPDVEIEEESQSNDLEDRIIIEFIDTEGNSYDKPKAKRKKNADDLYSDYETDWATPVNNRNKNKGEKNVEQELVEEQEIVEEEVVEEKAKEELSKNEKVKEIEEQRETEAKQEQAIEDELIEEYEQSATQEVDNTEVEVKPKNVDLVDETENVNNKEDSKEEETEEEKPAKRMTAKEKAKAKKLRDKERAKARKEREKEMKARAKARKKKK